MKVEQVDPATLIPADYNPRSIDDHQLDALKRSLDRWGFVQPVIVNSKTGNIVGGHQRVTAALELAIETVPVVRVSLDDAAEKALNISLNKIGGQWDASRLSDLLQGLQGDGYDLLDLGFDDVELLDVLQDWEDGDNLAEIPPFDESKDTKVIKVVVSVDHATAIQEAIESVLDDGDWRYVVEVL